MSQPTLKSLLGKKNETAVLLRKWIAQSPGDFRIEDSGGNYLLGNVSAMGQYAHPVKSDNEIAGWVKGDENSGTIAGLLTLILQKESEKKKLGAEVLNLYQELNVIFNFSEKLAETIEPDTIARMTLEESGHSIPAHSGVVVLWDEQMKHLTMPAKSGETLFNEERLLANPGLLLKIALSGQSEIINDISFLKDKGIVEQDVHSIIYAAMKVKHRIMGAIILAGREPDQYSAAHLKMLITLAQQSSAAIESALLYEKNIREVREREEAILRIHEVTKKFVPHEFIRSLGKEVLTDVKLGDQVEKIVTVLFTDIRDFTSLSEQMSPEENFRFVSSFNERLGPIIRSNRGFINQYLGDSIMAIFPRNPEDALNAAIEMQHAVSDFNQQRISFDLPPIKTGIGMHTGSLIMGITGDEQRMDAATISDTVNTAARIESLTKYYKSSLLLSGETLRLIPNPDKYYFRPLGKVQLKGKFRLLSIYECINGYSFQEFKKKKTTLPVFQEAMNYYFEQSFEKAIPAFQSIINNDPEDRTANYFLEKALKYLGNGVPENWTGAEEMLHK